MNDKTKKPEVATGNINRDVRRVRPIFLYGAVALIASVGYLSFQVRNMERGVINFHIDLI